MHSSQHCTHLHTIIPITDEETKARGPGNSFKAEGIQHLHLSKSLIHLKKVLSSGWNIELGVRV